MLFDLGQLSRDLKSWSQLRVLSLYESWAHTALRYSIMGWFRALLAKVRRRRRRMQWSECDYS